MEKYVTEVRLKRSEKVFQALKVKIQNTHYQILNTNPIVPKW